MSVNIEKWTISYPTAQFDVLKGLVFYDQQSKNLQKIQSTIIYEEEKH